MTRLRSVAILTGLLWVVLVIGSGTEVSAATTFPAAPFTFTFSGNPPAPQPWNASGWDVVVNSRDTKTFSQLEGMQAQHGADCSPAPATHFNNTYEGAVFLCRNHIMTAINAHGYGEIVLTPDHMVDFSKGDATVSFDLSTLRTSYRDWIDVWITPIENNLVLPLNALTVDLQGPPQRGIHVKMDQFNGTVFRANVLDNFKSQSLPSKDGKSLERVIGSPSAVTRTTFELTVSATHLKFGAPKFGYNWVDTPLTSPLTWTRGIVQLAHHSYNPTKECTPKGLLTCQPNTWHWSNFSISNAVPFTLLKGDLTAVHAGTPATVTFPSPAPASSFLRFAAIGSIDISLDGGKTWKPAQHQAEKYHFAEHFANYWTPVPPGIRSVTIRGRNWFAGPWWVRDVTIWSTAAPSTAQIQPSQSAAPKVGAAPSPAPGGLVALLTSNLLLASGAALLALVLIAGLGYGSLMLWRRSRLRRLQ